MKPLNTDNSQTKLREEIEKFKQSMRENAELVLRHNSRSSTVGQKATEQLEDLKNL